MGQEKILLVSKNEKTYTEEEVIEAFNRLDSLDDIVKYVEKANDRLYISWATVDAVDKEGEKIPIDEAIEKKQVLMNRGAPIQDSHTNKNIGKTLAYKVAIHPDTKTVGILDLNKIYNDNALDDQVWSETVSGERSGSSVGGFNTKSSFGTDSDGSFFKSLLGFEWLETSNVKSPCNPFSTNPAVSLIAKENSNKMVDNQEVTKQEEVMTEETPETSVEDRIVKLEQAMSVLSEKLEEVLQATAGTPTEEVTEAEKAEENPEEDKEESTEKMEEEVDKEEPKEEEVTKSAFDSLKSEISELKKSLEDNKVVMVAKSEMPETKKVEKEGEVKDYKFSDVMKGTVSLNEFTNKQ